MLFDTRKDMDKVRGNIGKESMGIPSGIAALDDALFGFSSGEMITIGARPGIGKSSLARNIMLSTGKPETNHGAAILCTLEMPSVQIASLLTATLGKVNYRLIRRGVATERDMDRFEAASVRLNKYRIFIDYNPLVTPESIKALLLNISKQEKVACLLVDYLQLMSLHKTVENRQTEVSTISRELKAIAMEFKIPVIAFSQLNRQVEYRESGRPRMIDLRESGAMEQDSDKIILLHRPSYYNQMVDPNAEDNGEAEFIICKSRMDSRPIVNCAFIAEHTLFCDLPSEEF